MLMLLNIKNSISSLQLQINCIFPWLPWLLSRQVEMLEKITKIGLVSYMWAREAVYV